jgi:hypothetical protein
MSTTESPFSLTIKVGKNNDLLTGRADTAQEMMQRVSELRQLAALVEGPLQDVTATVTQREIPTFEPVTMQEAVNNLNAGGFTGQIIQGPESSIEMKEDKFGGQYIRGNPDAGSCNHGPRIVKDWVTKAGKRSKAYVCVNDSPFGDWKSDKCDLAWAK